MYLSERVTRVAYAFEVNNVSTADTSLTAVGATPRREQGKQSTTYGRTLCYLSVIRRWGDA